jgi:hypothetical protein
VTGAVAVKADKEGVGRVVRIDIDVGDARDIRAVRLQAKCFGLARGYVIDMRLDAALSYKHRRGDVCCRLPYHETDRSTPVMRSVRHTAMVRAAVCCTKCCRM